MSGSLANPNVILQAGQGTTQPINLLAAGQQVQSLQSNQLAIQQQQQELQSKLAIGQAAQQSIGPDGTIDQGKFRSLVSQDPNAAYAAQEAVGTSQAQQGQAIQNNDHQLFYQQHANTAIGSVLSSLATNPTPTSLAAAATLAKNLYPQAGGQVDQIVAGVMAHPQGISGGVKQLVNMMQGPEGQQANAYGTPVTADVGGGIASGVQNTGMNGGQLNIPGYTPKGVTPGEAVTQQPGQDAQGRPTATPLAARLAQEGMPLGPNNVPLPPGAANYPWNKTGAYGGASGISPASEPGATAPANAMSGMSPGSVTVGPAPGTAEANAVAPVQGAADESALMKASATTSDRKAVLNNMLNDLQDFSSGPGAVAFRHYAAVANNVLGTNIDAGGIQAAQSFDKFSQQISQQQAAALGAGSDAKLASAVAANPNSHLQTSTNQQMLHVLMGNEDAINAKANAWQNSGLASTPGAYQNWSQQFNQNFDPQVYQMLRMTPEERASKQQQMAKAGTLDQFRATTAAMGQAGLIPGYSVPSAQPAANGP